MSRHVLLSNPRETLYSCLLCECCVIQRLHIVCGVVISCVRVPACCLQEGDAVSLVLRPSFRGTHAAFAMAVEHDVVLKPPHIDFITAAAYPFAWCTALAAAAAVVCGYFCLLFECIFFAASCVSSAVVVRGIGSFW